MLSNKPLNCGYNGQGIAEGGKFQPYRLIELQTLIYFYLKCSSKNGRLICLTEQIQMKEKKHKEQCRRFDVQFKQQVLQMITNGRPVREVAESLGVGEHLIL